MKKQTRKPKAPAKVEKVDLGMLEWLATIQLVLVFIFGLAVIAQLSNIGDKLESIDRGNTQIMIDANDISKDVNKIKYSTIGTNHYLEKIAFPREKASKK